MTPTNPKQPVAIQNKIKADNLEVAGDVHNYRLCTENEVVN